MTFAGCRRCKCLLLHASAFNLGLLMQTRFGYRVSDVGIGGVGGGPAAFENDRRDRGTDDPCLRGGRDRCGGDVAGVAHHVIRGPAGRVRGGRPDNLGGESTGSACGAETGQASVGAASVCSGIGDVAAAREGQRIGAWDRAAGA